MVDSGGGELAQPLVCWRKEEGWLLSSDGGIHRVLKSKRRRATMAYYAGLDVSLEQTSVCVVDEAGAVVLFFWWAPA
jgi:hypothetical protein